MGHQLLAWSDHVFASSTTQLQSAVKNFLYHLQPCFKLLMYTPESRECSARQIVTIGGVEQKRRNEPWGHQKSRNFDWYMGCQLLAWFDHGFASSTTQLQSVVKNFLHHLQPCFKLLMYTPESRKCSARQIVAIGYVEQKRRNSICCHVKCMQITRYWRVWHAHL